ncbi:hypothetical protein Lal_00030684 [Lupinus albus]|nr:hypothetical protein Lal_00030684 [Lupinus albus]
MADIGIVTKITSPLYSHQDLNYRQYYMTQHCNIGHVNIGTPNHKLSKIEFHPQCDTNPPMALWDRISTCGAHSHIIPLPSISIHSKNPSGKVLSALSIAGDECIAHKNLTPLT